MSPISTAGLPRSVRSLVAQVRRALKGFMSDLPDYERLLPHVKGMTL